jgi:RNA polymerase sigma factor (sigma-70 family)
MIGSSTLASKNSIFYKNQLINSQPFIKRYVCSKIYNKSDAWDIIQEINRVLIEKESDFDFDPLRGSKENSFEKWACGIAKFQIMAFLTKLSRNKVRYVDEFYDSILFSNETDLSSFDLFKQDFEFSFLNILSVRERNVIVLLGLGYKQIEVCDILNIQPPHVSFYKKQAILKIRKHIQESS